MTKKRIEDQMSEYVKDGGLSEFLKDEPTTTITHLSREAMPQLPGVPTDPYDELRAYLKEKGLPFKSELQGGKDESVGREFRQFLDAGKTPEDFYRESETYLYHGIHLQTDVWQQPYRWVLREILPPPKSVIDFGCGVGGNGLYFQANGYDVSFADYESRCTDFLRWRLKLRGLDKLCYNIEADEIPKHDIAFAFDVIEHVPDPFAILKQLERVGRVVAVNLLTKIPETDSEEPQLHYRLDVPKILEYVDKKKVLVKRDFDYAWFVVYES